MRWMCALLALGGTAYANPPWDVEPDTIAEPDRGPVDIQGGMSVDYAHAVARADQLAFVRGVVRWIGHLNYFGAQLDGGLGYPGGPGYELHVRGGMQVHLDGVMRFHYAGFTLGAGLDSYGPLAARAWTFPIDGYWRVRFYDTLVGVHGGPRFAAGDRAFGWTAGVDVVQLRMWGRGDDPFTSNWGGWKPRDLVISVDATRLAGATFLGVELGFTARVLGGFYSG